MSTVIYVDIDDTLVRSFGNKRMPIPRTIQFVQWASTQGYQLICWSSGGAEYARNSAKECGIEELFQVFLPKPNVLIDDQKVSEWRRTVELHPNECTPESLLSELKAGV